MKKLPYKLSPSVQKILVSLSKALIQKPDDFDIPDADQQLLNRCEALISEFPKVFRMLFILGLCVFEHLPFFFGFGAKKFTNLLLAQQEKYTAVWLNCRLLPLREMFKGFRGIILVCYFSHPAVWEYLGYQPQTHIEMKIKQRREILEKNDPHTHRHW